MKLSRFGHFVKLCIIFLCIYASQYTSRAAAQNSSSGSIDLDRALSRGDIKAARAIEKSIGVGPFTRKIDDAQMKYDLPTLAKIANTCELEAFKAGALEAALHCNIIARSVAMSGMGDAHEYLLQSEWAKETLSPAIRARPGGRADFGGALDKLDIKSLLNTVPPTKFTIMSAKETLRVVNIATQASSAAPPAVDISINGKQISAFVDTGIAPNMIVTRTVAKSLGLMKIADNLTPTSYLGRPQSGGSAGIYLAREVNIGSFQLHNLLVGVLPDGDVPPGVYLGMAMLRKFGEVTLNNSQITLSANPSIKCKKPLPMIFATQSNEAGKLLFSAEANNRPAKAELDTGSSFLFLGNSDFFSYKMGYQEHPGQVGSASIDAIIDGESLKSVNAIILQSDRVPSGSNVIIGNPILHSYNVVLHLRDPSICFVKKVQ